MESRIICVDFDGTVVTHDFPEVGKPLAFAASVLQDLVEQGHRLILWTMRSGEHLEAAVQWFQERNIPLFGVNENPEQQTWTNSPKAYAHYYIDDAAVGCPTTGLLNHSRRAVDWSVLKRQLVNEGLLPDMGPNGTTACSNTD